jgi:hypothetical protein
MKIETLPYLERIGEQFRSIVQLRVIDEEIVVHATDYKSKLYDTKEEAEEMMEYTNNYIKKIFKKLSTKISNSEVYEHATSSTKS